MLAKRIMSGEVHQFVVTSLIECLPNGLILRRGASIVDVNTEWSSLFLSLNACQTNYVLEKCINRLVDDGVSQNVYIINEIILLKRMQPVCIIF